MKVLDSGHRYELASLDGEATQTLAFVKREGPHYPGNSGHHPGTTSQEVIRCLLERARYVNAQIPCPETESVIACLQMALFVLEARAKRVKGKHLQETTFSQIEAGMICDSCGHVSCAEHGDASIRALAPPDARASGASHTITSSQDGT